jgi:hypothetical protein
MGTFSTPRECYWHVMPHWRRKLKIDLTTRKKEDAGAGTGTGKGKEKGKGNSKKGQRPLESRLSILAFQPFALAYQPNIYSVLSITRDGHLTGREVEKVIFDYISNFS